MEFFEKELSDQLMGIFYEVRNKYGRFHRERFYDNVISEIFGLRGIVHINQPRIKQFSLDTGKEISYTVFDKLVADKIILELKAKPYTNKDDEMQCLEYLKTIPYEILYLVNFGEIQFKPHRYIYTNDRKLFLH